jgi:acetyl esterase
MATDQLDPEAQRLIDAGRAARHLPLSALTIDDARTRMRTGFLSHGPGPDVATVEELTIPGPLGGTRARLYRAEGVDEPLLVFIHGGGWLVNDLDTHDRLCRILAVEGHTSILSLDHKRGPEHRYPTALDEMLRCWLYVSAGSAELQVSDAIGIMGDSSGATLALGVAELALDLRLPRPALQCLVYPVADHYAAGRDSYMSRGVGYSLDAVTMRWFWDGYLPANWTANDPYLFPLKRPSFAGMPPTLIATAEFDPLRDDGLELASRLEGDGVPVEAYHLANQMHGFAMQTKTIALAREFVPKIAARAGAILRGDAVRQARSILP